MSSGTPPATKRRVAATLRMQIWVGEAARGHRGRDVAGRQRVDADAARREIDGGSARVESCQAGLGGHVARIVGEAARRVDARDVDDAGAAGTRQKRQSREDRRVGTDEIDRERVPESRQLRGGRRRAAAWAG